MRKYKVTLKEEERLELQEIALKGTHRSQKVLNVTLYFLIYRLHGCGENIYHSIRHCKHDMTLVLK